jgi:tetratricopeptide (TPR) repeat protein/serine/threonine protein kinase
MTAPRPDNEAIFHAARDIPDPDRRREYVRGACGGDEARIARVEALLAAADGPDSLLDRPAAGSPVATIELPTTDQVPHPEKPGTVIGPYKLLQQLGEGGMGTVFMAEQTQPVQRRVALKVVKPGLDSAQVIARFEQERQALALMDHPNIARVLDAGTTEAGRPYFVMELVKGVPITKYCDERRLTPRERLALFVPVCQAIQHAHQKGIIHRDVKPSNVLVTLYDGKPMPKVIDFGVAKAVEQRLTERTLFTQVGQVVGTVEYMSPEQAELNALDIDTRSDIYSLGVLLYELLTGSTPLEKQKLRSAAFAEMLRMIREEEPPRPSTRLSESGDTLPSISAQRKTEPAKLAKLVRGELDWIVMKALEKDRGRRYETANGFAMDVQRYLADEPVLACPPSAGYRLRKFARRNKTALTLAGLILFFIASLGGGVGWVVRDRAAQRAATRQEVELALKDAEQLRGQGKYAEAMVVANGAATRLASGGGDDDLERQVQGLLAELKRDEADRRMVARLEDIRLRRDNRKDDVIPTHSGASQPDYEAAFKEYGLPIFDLEVEEAARRIAASPLRDRLVAALDDCASNRMDLIQRLMPILARVYNDPWHKEYFDARRRYDAPAVLRLSKQPEALAQPPGSLVMLGWELRRIDWGPSAVEFLRRAHRQYPADLWINYELGECLRYMTGHSQDSQEGLRYAEESIGYFRAARALRPESQSLRWRLAASLTDAARHLLNKTDRDIPVLGSTLSASTVGLIASPRGQGPLLAISALFPERPKDADAVEIALTYLSEAVELAPAWQQAWTVRGDAYVKRGQLDKVIAAYSKAIELKPNDQGNRAAWNNRGDAYSKLGQLDKALADFSRAIELKTDDAVADYSKAIYPKSDDAKPWYNRGLTYFRLRQWDKAVADYSKAIDLKSDWVAAWNNRGVAYSELGLLDEALADYTKAIDLKSDYVEAWNNRGNAYSKLGQLDKALADYSRAIELKADYVEAWTNRGNAYSQLGLLDKALADQARAIELKADCAEAWNNRGNAYSKLGQLGKALADYSRAIELKADFALAWINRGNAYSQLGLLDKALADHTKAIELEADDAIPWFNRGNTYSGLRQWDEAVADYSKAINLKSDYAEAWNNRGGAYGQLGQWDKALADLSRAIELKADYVDALTNRGLAYFELGQPDKALADYAKAIELKADYLLAWYNRGNAYFGLRQWDKALADYSRAIELKADYVDTWINRGDAFRELGQLDKALADYSRAIELKADCVAAWYNRGNAYLGLRQWDKAVADFSKAISLKPDYAHAHCLRGYALMAKGDFPAALKALQRGHDLVQGDPAWSLPAEQQIKECERLIELDARLAKVLKREVEPADAAERIALASLCQRYKKRNVAAARFYTEAFGADPKLLDTLRAPHRYNAACAAALAGCGQGEDAATLDDKERVRLRGQALNWLRADLESWHKYLDKEPDQGRAPVQQTMRHWQQDVDFAGVRGAGALARLPEPERQPWQQLWDDVETLARRTAEPKK